MYQTPRVENEWVSQSVITGEKRQKERKNNWQVIKTRCENETVETEAKTKTKSQCKKNRKERKKTPSQLSRKQDPKE
jgi:hypothetical protein